MFKKLAATNECTKNCIVTYFGDINAAGSWLTTHGVGYTNSWGPMTPTPDGLNANTGKCEASPH